MTVKCLTEEQKFLIAHQYAHENQDVKVLATNYQRSRRTIQRVLVEKGVAPVRIRKPKVHKDPELPNLTFMETLKCMVKAIFYPKPTQRNVQPSK